MLNKYIHVLIYTSTVAGFIFLFVLSSTVIKRVLNTKVADEEHLKMPESEILLDHFLKVIVEKL